MAKYQLHPDGGVIDTEFGRTIPAAEGNRRWREYQEWLAEGNVPDPMPPPRALTAEEQLEIDLRQTDKEILRGFDWLLEYLVGNGTVVLADIPQALKDLYLARKALRDA